jgi:Spy/CpxP family protein refolding chaperone
MSVRGFGAGAARVATRLALALLCTALPGLVAAQTAGPAGEPPVRPLDLLLRQREALALTTGQLARIDEIRSRLASANDPLIERMLALRMQWQRARRMTGSAGGPPAAVRLRRIQTMASQIRVRIQRNNRLAMLEVNRVLTPEQRAQLRAIIDERRRDAAPPPGGGDPDAGTRD